MAARVTKLPVPDLTLVRIREVLDENYPEVDIDNDTLDEIKLPVNSLITKAKQKLEGLRQRLGKWSYWDIDLKMEVDCFMDGIKDLEAIIQGIENFVQDLVQMCENGLIDLTRELRITLREILQYQRIKVRRIGHKYVDRYRSQL